MTPPSPHDELQRLISALLDERLSPEEHARLEALLAADPQARRIYMQRIDQEIELPCLVAATQSSSSHTPRPAPANLLERLVTACFPWRRWIFASACALAVLAVVALLTSRQRSGTVPEDAAPAFAAEDSWSDDLESGDAAGWHGQLVTSGLPAGSKFGITSAPRDFPNSETTYVIQLPEDWQQGLAALTPQSTLNVTYRLGSPVHVNLFMHTISAQAGQRAFFMYHLPSTAFSGRPGRWQTVSIPFSGFVRKIVVDPGSAPQFRGGPPQSGEPVATISFASTVPNDLVIDRVWIAPAGPLREEITPLPNQPIP